MAEFTSANMLRIWIIACGYLYFTDGLNPKVVDDLYETIWHPNLVSIGKCIRINLILPLEVLGSVQQD